MTSQDTAQMTRDRSHWFKKFSFIVSDHNTFGAVFTTHGTKDRAKLPEGLKVQKGSKNCFTYEQLTIKIVRLCIISKKFLFILAVFLKNRK